MHLDTSQLKFSLKTWNNIMIGVGARASSGYALGLVRQDCVPCTLLAARV